MSRDPAWHAARPPATELVAIKFNDRYVPDLSPLSSTVTSRPGGPEATASITGQEQKSASQPEAKRVLADDDDDFERERPRRRACTGQVWKLQPMKRYLWRKRHHFAYFMKMVSLFMEIGCT